jgi:hypothetical protein
MTTSMERLRQSTASDWQYARQNLAEARRKELMFGSAAVIRGLNRTYADLANEHQREEQETHQVYLLVQSMEYWMERMTMALEASKPAADDTPETIIKKLKDLRRILATIVQNSNKGN